MDKEFLEMLKSLNGVLEDMLGDNENSLSNKMKKRIDEGFKEKATVSIEKFEDGTAQSHIEGSNIGVLIALAGLEKSVLEKLDVPKGVWELIKHSVGTKEAE